jgi:hypothetical protein
MTPKVIQIQDVVEELQRHGWHLSHSGPVKASDLPHHPPGDEFLPLIGHMFIATSENGGVMMGVIVVRPNGVVTTHSTQPCFDETVDHCAKKIMRRYERACDPVNTLTAIANTRTLH